MSVWNFVRSPYRWLTGHKAASRPVKAVAHALVGITFLVIALAVWMTVGDTAIGMKLCPPPRIVIVKSRQVLELYEGNVKIKSYHICLGLDPYGPKRITGDRRTPEGEYFICLKSTKSQYHRFLGISYPGEKDAEAGFESGIISRQTRDDIVEKVRSGEAPPWNTKLGGWVGIHGYPTDEYKHIWISLLYPKPHNWTDGCIAMWSFEIEDLFSRVGLGTPVSIVP